MGNHGAPTLVEKVVGLEVDGKWHLMSCKLVGCR
jgi:hypothetical protein